METKDILNEFLKTLLEGVEQAGAFVKEQLPLVLQEYVAWGIVEGAAMCILCSISVFVLCRLVVKWAVPSAKKASSNGDLDIGYWMAAIIMAIGCVPISFIAINGLLSAMKALIAPRVYLIEELSKLVQ